MRQLALALLVTLAVAGCKRPGTDRALQCERYGDLFLERHIECGGKVIDGVELTAETAEALTEKARSNCLANQKLTPTADCIKQLKTAPCDGKLPNLAAASACAK